MRKQVIRKTQPEPIDPRQAELVEASLWLHKRVQHLVDKYGFSDEETVEILNAEELYWSHDQFALPEGSMA